jgi:hypothetical protein
MTDPSRNRKLRRALTILVAFAVTLLTWALCTAVLGVDLVVDQGGPQPVPLGSVAVAPIVSGLAGWGLLALLERLFGGRGLRAWQLIAIVVGALSLISPVTMGLSAATVGWLLAFHVLVGAILIIGFSVSSPAAARTAHADTTVVNTAA